MWGHFPTVCVNRIGMNFCMNLAATVNVVLYDRLCKQQRVAA